MLSDLEESLKTVLFYIQNQQSDFYRTIYSRSPKARSYDILCQVISVCFRDYLN